MDPTRELLCKIDKTIKIWNQLYKEFGPNPIKVSFPDYLQNNSSIDKCTVLRIIHLKLLHQHGLCLGRVKCGVSTCKFKCYGGDGIVTQWNIFLFGEQLCTDKLEVSSILNKNINGVSKDDKND
jgi:hypothetical protein